MKWSYILFLPALVAFFWSALPVLFKKSITHAQVLISIALFLESASIVLLSIYFRGHSGGLFLYNYIFKFLSMLCAPIFYLGICSLTEAKGISVEQRRVLFLPLLYILCLTAGAITIGWRRYEAMCIAVRDGVACDPSVQFMYIIDHWVFPIFLVLVGFFLFVASTRKVWLYQKRFNDYYAHGLQVRPIDSRYLVIFCWIYLPLAAGIIYCIYTRPPYYKYWMIALSVLNAVSLWVIGQLNYRLDYDAKYLADYIREKNGMTDLD